MKRITWIAMCLAALGWARTHSNAGEKKGAEVEVDKYKSTAPADWKKLDKAANKFRIYQFVLPRVQGDKEDAELAVLYLQGQGGGVAENVKRWKGMFDPPGDKDIDDVSKVETFKVSGVEVTYLDVRGTYLYKNPPFAPNAKIERKPDFRMFSIYFNSENGPYFIRVTGPAKTMEHHKKNFDGWIKGFK